MKRSVINRYLRSAAEFFDSMDFKLPPFAFFSIADWKKHKADVTEVFDLSLGWDITDFGTGDFEKTGLLLFTIRNGRLGDASYPKPYAEKIMMVREQQVTPMHFHTHKMEDIINRGGGDLVITMHHSDANGGTTDAPVTVSVDGMRRTVKAGGTLRLKPGESITLPQKLYHTFHAENGNAMVGEVSMVNDDSGDNRFLKPMGRFPALDEDEAPVYLLCNDYNKFV
ncbi:MAG: D-lyxose/D-mannose family sugar isomerase [Spirochaetes bacterium]|nr:D-lyxose/D-mannose family sugar isomerase [Spirochaetota bacterium]